MAAAAASRMSFGWGLRWLKAEMFEHLERLPASDAARGEPSLDVGSLKVRERAVADAGEDCVCAVVGCDKRDDALAVLRIAAEESDRMTLGIRDHDQFGFAEVTGDASVHMILRHHDCYFTH